MFLVNWARKAVSNGRNTTVHKGELLDISVMQPERCRLLAMSYPCEGVYTIWRNDVYVVRNFLTERYGSDWRVFNLTETQYDPHLFYGAVTHLPIPDHHAPPLMKLLDYVQVILQYLEEKPTNVAVIHW
jgi:phosphatidylinositol-3,4,5-trisphosphate 3-phosphatase/dual-specificity protein phosphatase PTEN